MKARVQKSAPDSLFILLTMLVGLGLLLQACGKDADQFCEPDCAGLCCGDDGCGGVCPDLCEETGQVCDPESCECTGDCVPECTGLCCGDDGCGGTCPDVCAATGQVCDEENCACEGACAPQTCASSGKECGSWPDGCAGTFDCGACPGGQTCDADGACQEQCVPDCAGKCCGGDGCGGTCADNCAASEGFCDVASCTCESVCDYQFTPTTSFRRLDTRSEAKLAAGSVTAFEIAGRDGIPDSAQAVVVRLTAVAPEAAGFMTAYDAGATTPNASVLNYAADQVAGNTFFVKVGSDKKIRVFTSAATHLILDVFGYIPAAQAFTGQTPYRLLDTRQGTRPGANSTTCLAVAGVHGVPADAKAVSLVVTAVQPDADGSVVAFAKGQTAPATRSLSYVAGQVMANSSIVQVGADREICLRSTAGSHLIVDATGYFQVNAAYEPLTPYRKLDTTYAAGATTCVQVAGTDGIPADAQSVALNLTALNPTEQGFFTVYPKGTQRPVNSNLNHPAGQTTTNGVVSKVGSDGEVCIYQLGASRVQLDVVGYWPGMDSCCAGKLCESPPFIGCSGTVELISYPASGTCSRGTCDYGHTVTACGYLCQQDACVAAPSFPYHDRTEWQNPAYPVSSSGWMDINALDYITLHYIGVDGVDVSDVPQFLRNAQLDYVVNRGYSLGYNSAIDMDGEEWEIRGFDYRCAANGSQEVNIPSYSIVLLLPNTWSVPPANQIEGVRNLVAKIRATAAAAGNGRFLEINGHRDLKATSCPGDVIYNMIQNGTFEP